MTRNTARTTGSALDPPILSRSTLVTSPEEIKYEAIVSGRLLRVRFPLGQQYVSAICIYQYAWNNKDPKLVQKRHGIWQALDRCVRSVPQRELLIAGGDLNTQVSPQPPFVGPGTGMLSKDRAPDAEELINVLRTNHATLLNTWSARQDEAHTFRFGTRAAQLDYIIIRQKDVNMQAKQSRPIANCPLGAWRHLGGYHIPLKASIRKRVPPPRKQVTPNKKIDREQIIACARAPDDPGNAAQKIQRFRSKTQQQILDSVASVQDLGNIATRIAEVAEAVFLVRKQEIAKYSNPILLSMGITNMWKQWIAIKRTSKGKSLRDMLTRWKVWAAYLRQYRAHKKQCQERKKQYHQDNMKEAELASRKHDLRSVRNIVRSLAPKAPRARTQLKGKDGGMLSRAEEAEVFCEHFKQKFTSANAWRYDAATLYLNNIEHSQNSQQLIDCEQLCHELLKAPLRKAVPPGHPPSATWRLFADLAATTITTVLNGSWEVGPITIPQGWSDAHLVLIKKPGKTGRDPNRHRPIGLQDQLGKITFKHVLDPFLDDLHCIVKKFPQYGHVPGRGTTDALRRVRAHCHEIREACHGQGHSVLRRFHGQTPPSTVGGLQITDDLAKAFDAMPREHLLNGLLDLGIPSRVIDVVMTWHFIT